MMNTITLDINELREEIIHILQQEKCIVLATCAGGRVTARAMSAINNGLDIWFQTDLRFLKVEQMQKNPNVALCTGNLQIEGIAKFKGHPSEPGNMNFCSLYRQKHPGSFERYASLKNEVVIQVKPILFTLWRYVDGVPCRDFLDMVEEQAWREFYQTDAL